MDLEKRLLPRSFEHAVHHVLDHEFELSRFDTRYCNDQKAKDSTGLDLAKLLQDQPDLAQRYAFTKPGSRRFLIA